MQSQIKQAIRLNDIVLLVLSGASIKSDWVEAELEWARDREAKEERSILCPVALDDSWKKKQKDKLWRQAFKKHVLAFSDWGNDTTFDVEFAKLLKGLMVYYPPKGEPAAAAT